MTILRYRSRVKRSKRSRVKRSKRSRVKRSKRNSRVKRSKRSRVKRSKRSKRNSRVKRSRTAVKFNYDGATHACPYEGCTYTTEKKTNFDNHIRTHTRERPFPCEFEGGCGFSAATKNHLKIHIRTHTGERPFPCEFEGCEYRAATQSTLNTHLLSDKHKFIMDEMTSSVPGGRVASIHKCDHEGCNYVSSKISVLKRHESTHTGVRPFVCGLVGCDFATAQNTNLIRHRRTRNHYMLPHIFDELVTTPSNKISFGIPDEYSENDVNTMFLNEAHTGVDNPFKDLTDETYTGIPDSKMSDDEEYYETHFAEF